MKILVPIKRVPDYEQKVKLSPSGDSIQTENTKWVVNPFDEIAVEEALKLKEKRPDTEVVVVSIGPQAASEQIRTALAMGADRGILIVSDAPVDSDVAARLLEAVYRQDNYQIVIMGKQSVDSDANQTGQLLAAGLDLPQATFASKVVLNDEWTSATVTREVDGGLETIQVACPCVVTTDLRLNTPRYPTLPNIVKAKKKPIAELAASSLGADCAPKVVVRKLSTPPARQAGKKVQTAAELVSLLKNEAKVI
ncbi:MAG: electron transfer flavoprotein subunit beta/FixA family protein [Bdellovibrionota bacterium]